MRHVRGRPRNTWTRQVEVDSGLAADYVWDTAGGRCQWRAQRPLAVYTYMMMMMMII